MKKLKEMGVLFFTMLKIGLFTFGGGYAMISLLQAELVERKQWLDREEFLDMTAIAESTPGPIAINSATFIGYRRAGVLGSLVATVGVCLPSFVIIYVISLFFEAFLSLTVVGYAFAGIRAAVVYLILSAGVKMLRGIKKRPMELCLLGATVLLMVVLTLLSANVSAILYILAGGCIGLAVFFLGRLRGGETK